MSAMGIIFVAIYTIYLSNRRGMFILQTGWCNIASGIFSNVLMGYVAIKILFIAVTADVLALLWLTPVLLFQLAVNGGVDRTNRIIGIRWYFVCSLGLVFLFRINKGTIFYGIICDYIRKWNVCILIHTNMIEILF